MRGVATGCSVAFEKILFLNLRAWQYDYLTYSCPQAAKTTLWIRQPKSPAGNDKFLPFAVWWNDVRKVL
jgi:hypothetical protein